MDQKQIVYNFVESLGGIAPIIDGELLTNYITNIVVDMSSLQEFISYTDRYLKHNQTFQMGFLLHSLASVLDFASIGNPIDAVVTSIPTSALKIPLDEMQRLAKTDAAKRYNKLCLLLMNPKLSAASDLNVIIIAGREKEKLDDGGNVNPMFNPMSSVFPKEDPGVDLTEDTEVKI